jgi:hypothetical protein
MTTTPTNPQPPLTDIGLATPPPAWCLPGTEPEWYQLTEQAGGYAVCSWQRNVTDDVWIAAEDRIIDGRVMRTAPMILYWEPPAEGVTVAQAREVAAGLIAAADVLTCALLDETTR